MAKATKISNTGFDTKTGNIAGRLINKNGSPNVKRTGLSFFERFSIYHWLINISTLKFIFLIIGVYTFINLIFAFVYFSLPGDALSVHDLVKCPFGYFYNCFFFSAQTLTTVGYGRISPVSFSANLIASIESLLGLMLFALITGLLYGRFSKPKGNIIFSDVCVLGPYDNITGLMVRLVSATAHTLTDVEASITLALLVENGDARIYDYYTVPLEIAKINSLALNWTIVHPINEESPLFGLTEEDLKRRKMEVLVFIKGFDKHYSTQVQQQTSYAMEELVYGAKFSPMFIQHKSENYTELLLDKISDYHRVALA